MFIPSPLLALSLPLLSIARVSAADAVSPALQGTPFQSGSESGSWDPNTAPTGSEFQASQLDFKKAKPVKPIPPPKTPKGYELVFGPLNGANEAPGYMGFVSLSAYDVAQCAKTCNERSFDAHGGVCKYFNIFNNVVNGTSVRFTCSMYYLPSNASTAINHGQGPLTITDSRGYRRISLLPDGGFEAYTCPNGAMFCFANVTSNWRGISSTGSRGMDATIIHYPAYAHSGSSVGLLGEISQLDSFNGTLIPTKRLDTEHKKTYSVSFFHWSGYADPVSEADAFVEVLWNDQVVLTIKPGFSAWTFYSVPNVSAKGHDVLAFRGGKAPAWSFIDDIFVFRNSV